MTVPRAEIAPARASGRPRNEAHSDAAKQAAIELLRESGYASINMETVAQRSGISRQTLYRRWPHKRALILDAFAEQADTLPVLPDTGNLKDDLTGLLRATCACLAGQCGSINRSLVDCQLGLDRSCRVKHEAEIRGAPDG